MFGFDYMQQRANDDEAYGDAPDLDVLHPDYYMDIPALTPALSYVTRSHQIGVYGQDEIRWKRFILNGSIRNDWYRSHQIESIEQSDTRQSASQITWRASGYIISILAWLPISATQRLFSLSLVVFQMMAA